jgi:hypothetical protein
MVCPKCNSQYDDSLAACPFCSATEQAPAQETAFQVPQGAAEFAPPAPVKKKKSSKLIPVIAILVAVIAGIVSFVMNNKESTHTLVYQEKTEMFDMSMTMDFYCKGDKVQKIVRTIEYDYDDEYESLIEAIAPELAAELCSEYDDYDFIDYSYSTDGTTVTITIEYNEITENLDTYVELELVDGEGDYLSYKKVEANMKEEGYTVVE